MYKDLRFLVKNSNELNQVSDVNLRIIKEPVDLWRDLKGTNMLKLMYENPHRWACTFHTYVQLTMLQNHLFVLDIEKIQIKLITEVLLV